MKALRWTAALTLALALAAGAALLVLRRLVPPEKLQALAVEKLSAALGREVRIGGVALGLRGVSLSGVEIGEDPAFGKGPFLKAGRLSARWSLRALLARRIAIEDVALSGFECRLVQDKLGRLNAATLGAPKGAAPAAPPAKGAAPAAGPQVSVRRVSAGHGTVSYADAAGARFELRDVRAEVSDLGAGAAFPAKLAFDLEAAKGTSRWKGAASFDGKVKLGKDGALALSFDPLKLEASGLKVSLTGKAQKAADGSASVSAKGKLPALDAKALQGLMKGAPAGLSIPAGTLSVEARWSGGKLTLSPLELALGEAKLSVKGSAAVPAGGKGQTQLDLRVSAQDLPLEALAPLSGALAAKSVSGRAGADVRVTGPAGAPILAGTAKVAGLAASQSGLALTGASLDATFDPKQVKAKLLGRLGSGELAVEVEALDYRSAPDVRVQGSLSELDLGAWSGGSKPAAEDGKPAEAAPPPAEQAKAAPLKTSGTFAIGALKHPNFHAQSLKLEWELAGVTPALEKLGGKASVRLGAGKFEDLRQLTAKSRIAKVALLPFLILQKTAGLVKLPLLPAFDKVAFKEITGDYLFDNGVMTVKESHMDSSAGYVTTTGNADLARDRLDLRIAAKVGGLAQGKISGPLAFFVRGSTKDPQVKPDVAAILKQPGVEQAIDAGKKLLQGIFK